MSDENAEPLDLLRRRLRYRARYRGTLEADRLIGAFAEAFLPQAERDDLLFFGKLLDVVDPIMQNTPPPLREHKVFRDLQVFTSKNNAGGL